MKQIRTIIIDDERYACERLKKLLVPYPQIQVLDYFTDPARAIESIRKLKPELLFLDVELGNNISAFDIIEKLDSTLFRPEIILVTAHPQYSIKAIKHRVFDYIMKPVDIDELEDTLERFINQHSSGSFTAMDSYPMLSQREKAVLRHVLEGKSSREIAGMLYISINTVNTHRRNILKKTGAESTLELLGKYKKNHD